MCFLAYFSALVLVPVHYCILSKVGNLIYIKYSLDAQDYICIRMKKIISIVGIITVLTAGCKKQQVSTTSRLAGNYTWSGVDTSIMIVDTNTVFVTTASVVTDTSFSIQVLNNTQIVVSILSPIYKFDGEVLYNQLDLVETNADLKTMTFYAPATTDYNFYCITPQGHVATRSEYLTYNYGTHVVTYDLYMTDDLKEQWALHLQSPGK